MAQSQGGTNTSPLVFHVTRRAPMLIPPAGRTPYEFKELSDIDDQDGLRFQIPLVFFYQGDGSGRDPARVIKEAVGKALVWYYPLAGRLREKEGRKLVVECNAQGIMFIEADADVTLNEFGKPIQPPFPCFDQLLFDVPGSDAILDSPLLLFQVTRLKCGGFIFALRLNHAIADAYGLFEFMNTISEFARGAESPTIQPVWERHLLCARDPPQVTCEHYEYEDVVDTEATIVPLEDMIHKSFFFGPAEIVALRRFIPPHMKASTFEILTACLWRCRTISLKPNPEDIVRIIFTVNCRTLSNSPIPQGFYGNAFAIPIALSIASKLSNNPIAYALELVKRAKANVDQEYLRSVADLMVIKGRPHFTVVRNFLVSNLARVGFDNLDFGWGEPVYGGIVGGGIGKVSGFLNFYVPSKNENGDKGILVPICLPRNAMQIFINELNRLLCETTPYHPNSASSSSFYISSSL